MSVRVQAYYGLRNGGSGGRIITTAAEAEKILRGGYGVTMVTLRDEDDQIIGAREWRDVDGKEMWVWWFEQDVFE